METLDSYIDTFDEKTQVVLEEIRSAIQEVAPQAEECISYKIPTYKLKGNLVHFAGYKKHIGFYPAPSGIKEFKTEIEKFKWAKGSVQFPLDAPLPIDLIKRITEFRVKENLGLL